MASVGPKLPSHLLKRKYANDEEEDDHSTPPTKIRAASPAKERRVLGPAPPPAPLNERPLHSSEGEQREAASNDGSSSGNDDDFGPRLPPGRGTVSATDYDDEEPSRLQREADEAAAGRAQPPKPQREEWMLLPPSDSDWSLRVDPTKLKNRKFASGRGAKAPAEKTGVSSIWTETPEEKRKRLEDEVMGRKDLQASMQSKPKPKKDDAEAEATARRIREYNEKNRGQSLYDEHKKATPKEKEDDPSKRAFDKEKDIGLGGRIGHVQRKDMLKRAGDFGSRFERGTFL